MRNEKSWLRRRRFGSPTGRIEERFDCVVRALSDISVENDCANGVVTKVAGALLLKAI